MHELLKKINIQYDASLTLAILAASRDHAQRRASATGGGHSASLVILICLWSRILRSQQSVLSVISR